MNNGLDYIFFRTSLSGYIWLTLSAVAGGLGNSLEPVSVLAVLQTTFLIAGLHIAAWNDNQKVDQDKKDRNGDNDEAGQELRPQTTVVMATRRQALLLLFVVLIQGAGTCLGFATLFAYPTMTALSLFTSFVAGMILWTLFTLLSVLPHLCFAAQYPSSWAVALTYPLTYTVLSVTLVGRLFSTLPAVGNAVLDFGALKQTASLLGIFGVTFLTVLLGTVSGLEMGCAACPGPGSGQQVSYDEM